MNFKISKFKKILSNISIHIGPQISLISKRFQDRKLRLTNLMSSSLFLLQTNKPIKNIDHKNQKQEEIKLDASNT